MNNQSEYEKLNDYLKNTLSKEDLANASELINELKPALSHKEDNTLPVEEKHQPEDLLKHIDTVTEFNKWRRGEESEMRSPTDIGIAIDVCLKAARSSLNTHPAPLEVEPSEDLTTQMFEALQKWYDECDTLQVASQRMSAIAQRHAEETAKDLLKWCWDNRVIYYNVDENSFRIHGTSRVFSYEEIYAKFTSTIKTTHHE